MFTAILLAISRGAFAETVEADKPNTPQSVEELSTEIAKAVDRENIVVITEIPASLSA